MFDKCFCLSRVGRSLIYLILMWISFLLGMATPWANLSFKDAECCLGVSDYGLTACSAFINHTCEKTRMVVNVFKGLCDADNSDCTEWKDSFWEDLDTSNDRYNECFYHSESSTHFQDDQDKWTSVGALVVIAFLLVTFHLLHFFIGHYVNENYKKFLQQCTVLVTFVTMICGFIAMSIAFRTSTMSPSAIYNAQTFVLSWNVWAQMNYGCQGAEYYPSSGVVMECMGAIFSLILLCFTIKDLIYTDKEALVKEGGSTFTTPINAAPSSNPAYIPPEVPKQGTNFVI